MTPAAQALPFARPAHSLALEDALRTELRLMDELDRQLQLQRAAVAHADAARLDECVHAAGRVLVTLEEARRRRRQLCFLLLGDAEIAPADIPDALQEPEDGELRRLIASVLALAATVSRTIAINRRVLEGALRSGRELIQVLHGEPPGELVYQRDARPAAPGALVNRRI